MSSSARTVLVVDDSAFMRKLVSEILATDGAPVEYGEPLIALMPHEAIGRAAD